MKTNRKYIAALLIAVLVLTGCGSTPEISGQITPVETQAVPEDKPVSLGRMEGGVYTNEYAGFGCTLDSNWQFYTAEELQQLPENVDAMLEDTDLGDLASELEQITDMMAENVNDMASINIIYTKLSMQDRLAYATMTEEQVIDSILTQSDMLLQSYAQAGIEATSIEKVQITFLGETHFATKTTATIQGISYHVLQLFDYHAGQYGITTTLACFMEDRTDSLLELFYPVN